MFICLNAIFSRTCDILFLRYTLNCMPNLIHMFYVLNSSLVTCVYPRNCLDGDDQAARVVEKAMMMMMLRKKGRENGVDAVC